MKARGKRLIRNASAKGAQYESQGQAPNNVRRVAPGKSALIREALKERNNWSVFRTFSALFKIILVTRGDALRACHWLLYSAPLALDCRYVSRSLFSVPPLCS